MPLTMGQFRKLSQLSQLSTETQPAAAELVAEALLRGVARQAIISAAASAVAQLEGRGHLSSSLLFPMPTVAPPGRPGGPVDDDEENPANQPKSSGP